MIPGIVSVVIDITQGTKSGEIEEALYPTLNKISRLLDFPESNQLRTSCRPHYPKTRN